MAGGLIQGYSRRGGHRRQQYRPLSEINVTPFVDVMLVLLIVFMVTAPLLTVGSSCAATAPSPMAASWRSWGW